MNGLNNNAVITGTSLISFSGVSASFRNDILDVLMYADFYATQTWRPQSQWTSWMEYYRKQLVYSGCQLKSLLVKEPMVINHARELDRVSFGIVGSAKASGLLELAQRSFKAARLSEYARHFFQFGSDAGYFSAFQVVPCESTSAGDVSILVCGVHASATVTSGSRGGDWQSDREMVVRLAGGVYQLNEKVYAAHRQRIQSRLLEAGRFNLQQLSI